MLKSTFTIGFLFLLASMGCNSGLSPFSTQTDSSTPQQEGQKVQQGSGDKVATIYHPAMLDPTKAVEQAPAVYKVKFETTKGDFVMECHRDWSPEGADRFYNLCKIGYMKDISIFRAMTGFMIQFGIHGDPAVNAKWSNANIKDDPRVASISNEKGFISFAKTERPNSRSTQMFINLSNNAGLDPQGFTPFGKIIDGMNILDRIHTEKGGNPGSFQSKFEAQGNAYVKAMNPNHDFIKSATIFE